MNLNIIIKKLNNDLNKNYSKNISQLTDLEYIELKDIIHSSLYEEKVLLNKETMNLIDSRYYEYIIQLLPCIKNQYSDKYLTKLVLSIVNNVKQKYSTYQYNKFMYNSTVFLNIYDLINTEYLSKKEQKMLRKLYPFYPDINEDHEKKEVRVYDVEELLFYNDIRMSNEMIVCCAFLSGHKTLFDKYITSNDNEIIRILCSSEKMQKQPLFNYARSLVQQILNNEENQAHLSSADIASIKSNNLLDIKDNKYENIKTRSKYEISINSRTSEVIKDMVINAPFDSIIDCFNDRHLRLVEFKNQDEQDRFLLNLMSRYELSDERYLKLLSIPVYKQLTNYLAIILNQSNEKELFVKSVLYFVSNIYKKNDNLEINEINLEI
jgi:hypothetical protein